MYYKCFSCEYICSYNVLNSKISSSFNIRPNAEQQLFGAILSESKYKEFFFRLAFNWFCLLAREFFSVANIIMHVQFSFPDCSFQLFYLCRCLLDLSLASRYCSVGYICEFTDTCKVEQPIATIRTTKLHARIYSETSLSSHLVRQSACL